MASFPFPAEDKSKKNFYREILPIPSQRVTTLRSVSQAKVQLPGTTDRHNYVDNQSVNHRRSLTQGHAHAYATVGAQRVIASNKNNSDKADTTPSDEGRQHRVTLRELHEVRGQLVLCKQRLRTACKVIESREATIRAMKERLSAMEMYAMEDAVLRLEHGDQLKILDRCIELEGQVAEMNKFFRDYGLTFVGDGRRDDPETIPNKPLFRVNFTLLLNRVSELNLCVREGESRIVFNNQGAAFKTPESVPLAIYSNGIILFSGPFRDYEDPATQAFIQDLLDGFFPSELQSAYPEGVPFKVVDKREVVFDASRSRCRVFGGCGNTLGHGTERRVLSRLIEGGSAETDAQNLTSPSSPVTESTVRPASKEKTSPRNRSTAAESVADKDSIDSRPGRKRLQRVESKVNVRRLTGEEFLKKLPTAVVRNGRVIQIREAVAQYCKSPHRIVSPCSTIRVDDSSEQDIQLKVRSADGSETFLVHISPLRTVEDLHKCLASVSDNGDLLLRSESARYCVLAEARQLQDCGLDCNSVLVLRPRVRTEM